MTPQSPFSTQNILGRAFLHTHASRPRPSSALTWHSRLLTRLCPHPPAPRARAPGSPSPGPECTPVLPQGPRERMSPAAGYREAACAPGTGPFLGAGAAGLEALLYPGAHGGHAQTRGVLVVGGPDPSCPQAPRGSQKPGVFSFF